MSFQRILCPVDFSRDSEHAVRVAARLATRDSAELVIAHAWYAGEYALGTYAFPPTAVEQMIQEEERGLVAAVRDARSAGAERVSSQLLMGYPWQEIVETLRNDPTFDLVVIGTRGRTGLSRILLGSVAEKLVRHAPCPVLVTRVGAEVAPFRSVLCVVDFSEGSRHALELAAKVVEPGGAGITLLHVIEPPTTVRGELATAKLLAELDERVARQLDQWAADLRARTAGSVATRLAKGSPGAEILGVLDAKPRFDLVVTGSRGRTGLRRALLGSVAEKIVRHAPCPVLVARSPEAP